MKPSSFEYLAPETLPEALQLRAAHTYDSAVLAGGQSLTPLLAMRLAAPPVLLDLARIPALAGVRREGGQVRVGAMTRHRDVERADAVLEGCDLLAKGTRLVGHTAIRNRGTLGGSIAHADGAAELPAIAVALDADMVVASTRGERTVSASEFFQGFLTTALEPDELLVEVRFPAGGPDVRTAIAEVSRRHGDFALVGVVASVALDADGAIADARIAFLGVGGSPVRAARAAEAGLHGQRPGAEVFAQAARQAVEGLEPPDDIHASGRYRRRVAETLTRRVLTEATA